jgi:hypothetical protein
LLTGRSTTGSIPEVRAGDPPGSKNAAFSMKIVRVYIRNTKAYVAPAEGTPSYNWIKGPVIVTGADQAMLSEALRASFAAAPDARPTNETSDSKNLLLEASGLKDYGTLKKGLKNFDVYADETSTKIERWVPYPGTTKGYTRDEEWTKLLQPTSLEEVARIILEAAPTTPGL